ncbi:MAG: conjugal transfer protein TraX [Eggerthellaceae bacterium]|nr:conjugal transfer protein TraX [Eggerthellaceae bacterium]
MGQNRLGTPGFKFGASAFTLKIAAIVGMTCNHVANVFCTNMPDAAAILLYSLGGVTFPIMCYLLIEGYLHTSNLRKYALRLALFAIISQVPYSLLWGAIPNVLWTLLVCLGLLWAYDNFEKRWQFWLVAAFAYVATAPFDWGGVGIAMAVMFYLLRNQRNGIAIVMLIPLAATAISPICQLAEIYAAYGISPLTELIAIFDFNPETTALFLSMSDAENFILQSGFFVSKFSFIGYGTIGLGLASLLLYAYDGTRGKPLKFLFYAFYPAHLLVIWMISLVI